ncbi:inverted formin-2-like [Sycon ciliatum]|uniref:inverted formin-2-like n=1 Tax=Sycon ciliatum TaxID=27933 RepID=UPI0031F710E7
MEEELAAANDQRPSGAAGGERRSSAESGEERRPSRAAEAAKPEKQPSVWSKVVAAVRRIRTDDDTYDPNLLSSPKITADNISRTNVRYLCHLKWHLEKTGKDEAWRQWVVEFLHVGGLQALFACLNEMMKGRITFCDVTVQLECVKCIELVLNTPMGINHLLDTAVGQVVFFSNGMLNDYTLVRNEIAGLLACLALYDREGFRLALEVLQNIQLKLSLRNKFSYIMTQLDTYIMHPGYVFNLLGLVNTLLTQAITVQERRKILAELMSCGMDEKVYMIKSISELGSKEIAIQLQVYEEIKDIEENRSEPGDIDQEIDARTSLSLCCEIDNLVRDTPHHQDFHTVLQVLLLIDRDPPHKKDRWRVTKKLVTKVLLAEEDVLQDLALRLKDSSMTLCDCYHVLKNEPLRKKKGPSDGPPRPASLSERVLCSLDSDSYTCAPESTSATLAQAAPAAPAPDIHLPAVSPVDLSEGQMQQLPAEQHMGRYSRGDSTTPPPAPGSPDLAAAASADMAFPPPPSQSMEGAAFPPPPLEAMEGAAVYTAAPAAAATATGDTGATAAAASASLTTPPLAPPLPSTNVTGIEEIEAAAEQSSVPMPTKRMKKLNWETMSAQEVANLPGNSVWKMIQASGKMNEDLVGYAELERLFCLPEKSLSAERLDAPRPAPPPPPQRSTIVTLLDSRKSMAIGILLKKLKRPLSQVVTDLTGYGTHSDSTTECNIGLDDLRMLFRLLPDQRTIEMIRVYPGDISKLADPELFCLELSEVPDYRLLLKTEILIKEFAHIHSSSTESLWDLDSAIAALVDNEKLAQVFGLVLQIGNFTNKRGFSGGASGFRLASLLKMDDTRTGNTDRTTLMNYLLIAIEEHHSDLLSLPIELLSILKKASKVSLSHIETSIDSSEAELATISKAMETADKRSKRRTTTRLRDIIITIPTIRDQLDRIRYLGLGLATYLGEPTENFQLEATIDLLAKFVKRFEDAHEENTRRRKIAEEHAKHAGRMLSTSMDDTYIRLNNLKDEIGRGFKLDPSRPVRRNSLKMLDYQEMPGLDIPLDFPGLASASGAAQSHGDLQDEASILDTSNASLMATRSQAKSEANITQQEEQEQWQDRAGLESSRLKYHGKQRGSGRRKSMSLMNLIPWRRNSSSGQADQADDEPAVSLATRRTSTIASSNRAVDRQLSPSQPKQVAEERDSTTVYLGPKELIAAAYVLENPQLKSSSVPAQYSLDSDDEEDAPAGAAQAAAKVPAGSSETAAAATLAQVVASAEGPLPALAEDVEGLDQLSTSLNIYARGTSASATAGTAGTGFEQASDQPRKRKRSSSAQRQQPASAPQSIRSKLSTALHARRRKSTSTQQEAPVTGQEAPTARQEAPVTGEEGGEKSLGPAPQAEYPPSVQQGAGESSSRVSFV